MKTIANFGTLMEAELLKLKLASFGIDAFIPDELTAGVAPISLQPGRVFACRLRRKMLKVPRLPCLVKWILSPMIFQLRESKGTR